MTTSLPASGSDSQAFSLLDARIQRWIWSEGWSTLRDAQEQAIPALIEADRDVIVAAATAAGKTEAAFFPIMTHLLRDEPAQLGLVLYVSPLKALINDQWSRLHRLCQSVEVPVVAWHGDVAASRKHQFLKQPQGVLLITPESLEALFVMRGSAMPGLMAKLRYIVVDELHAFIGSERGKQLQSLLHRVDRAAGQPVPRVGLSATLGDMELAARFLRPSAGDKVHQIVAQSGGQRVEILLKGYSETLPRIESDSEQENPELEDVVPGSVVAVAAHLYQALRGSNNLVFPNSRRLVEIYADLLRRHCERDCAPNEFWAHHGSLAKDYREDAERALKEGSRPATAICTTTMELGIDIGSVKSVCQIGPPPSVASLRQRLGRSGRRNGESAILRGYCIEPALGAKSDLSDNLREGLVQSVAMIGLLVDGWFEPPRVGGIHGSTLVQQILSIIAERGGVQTRELWGTLVAQDCPFAGLSRQDFFLLLKCMGERRLLIQDSSGLLLHGELGEKLVNHYDFFAVFTRDEEFRLICDGKTLGSLPVTRPLAPQQRIIFAGRRWRVLEVDSDNKLILVAPDKGGAPPAFEGSGAMVHDRVRQKMRAVLASPNQLPFLDRGARTLLAEGRSYYQQAGLDANQILQRGNDVSLLTWHGDWVNDALALLLARSGLLASNEGLVLKITGGTRERVLATLGEIAELDNVDPVLLLSSAQNTFRNKWDWALPEAIARRSFASLCLDLPGALSTARSLSRPDEALRN
ncbi:MAG: DEAD/DEAH box helicase [Candidatus Accumulibacter sp.]|uniref:DEAD/DEAH box helicase n=1 Tax=Accumulibacter sp. TaxID=2053492 RepID=UPI00287A0E68|nr:DEAD/DEAH box helicase [Accumulibacter sp.]MDS4016607.1 DEAD/DEAH box helicase [Accumulibacter sp.]